MLGAAVAVAIAASLASGGGGWPHPPTYMEQLGVQQYMDNRVEGVPNTGLFRTRCKPVSMTSASRWTCFTDRMDERPITRYVYRVRVFEDGSAAFGWMAILALPPITRR